MNDFGNGFIVSIHSRLLSREIRLVPDESGQYLGVSIHSRLLSREILRTIVVSNFGFKRFNPLPAIKPGDTAAT